MKKKQLLIGGGIAVILLLLFGVWNLWFSATKVAFINYQVISLGQISKANDNSFIKISELSTDDLNRLTSYDHVWGEEFHACIIEQAEFEAIWETHTYDGALK